MGVKQNSSKVQDQQFQRELYHVPASTTTTPSVSMSRIRQNFEEATEALINKQINMEFYASYVYLSMSAFFNRDDQALHGFAKFFKKSSDEEREHGMKLMEYQTKGADAPSSRTSASRPPWNGEPPFRLCWVPWSLRKRRTRACLTCTPPPGRRETPTSATSLRPTT